MKIDAKINFSMYANGDLSLYFQSEIYSVIFYFNLKSKTYINVVKSYQVPEVVTVPTKGFLKSSCLSNINHLTYYNIFPSSLSRHSSIIGGLRA